MTDAYRKRWLVVGFVWVAAILVAGWNLQGIADVTAARERWEVFSACRTFLEGREQDIADANRRVEQLSLFVESPAFGLLAVEEELRRLGDRYELHEIRFDSKSGVQGRDALPLAVTLRGPLSRVTQWVSALQSTLPFLSITDVHMQAAEEVLPSFTLHLNVRYKIAPPQTK